MRVTCGDLIDEYLTTEKQMVMRFRSPDFWYTKPNIFLKIILKPLSLIYGFFADRNHRKSHRYNSAESIVIAVGGITAGGAGKTMVVKAICEILQDNQQNVAVISKGYGRSSGQTLLVDQVQHNYHDVGDEPLILSKVAPVYVANDRAEAAKLAESQQKFDFFILDDGLSQRRLKPDIKILVVDAKQKFGNGELLPLGPNRLNFKKIESEIDIIIIVGTCTAEELHISTPEKIIYADVTIKTKKMSQNVIAFCGLGYPQKFFASLIDMNVVKCYAFPDHYQYTDKDIEKLLEESTRLNASLITTEKDIVKISKQYRKHITVADVTLSWNKDIYSIMNKTIERNVRNSCL